MELQPYEKSWILPVLDVHFAQTNMGGWAKEGRRIIT